MTYSIPSHLHRNRHGVFGFRVVIPQDLRLCFPAREYRVSLRTSNRRQAVQVALSLSNFVQRYFQRLRSMPYADLIAITSEFLAHLRVAAARAGTAVTDAGEPDLDDPAFLRLAASSLDSRIPGAGEALLALAERQKELDVRKKELLHRGWAAASREDDADVNEAFLDLYASLAAFKQDEARLANGIATLKQEVVFASADLARMEELAQLEQRAKDEEDRLTTLVARILTKTGHTPFSSPETPSLQSQSPAASMPLLSAAVDGYRAEQMRTQAWTEKTQAENEAIFALWVRIVGDQPIAMYGHEQHRAYKDTLAKLPANLNKLPRYKGKSIQQILALGDTPAALNTVNKNLTRVAALFKWAVAHGYTTVNPASGMLLKATRRAKDEREAFNGEDLKRLFSQDEYQKRGASRYTYVYWAPLIALFTGARLNEIAQLHLSDFQVVDGINVISINEQGADKKLKTPAAARLIPVHPELLRLGLILHVESLRERKVLRLFPELPKSRDGYGTNISKWFARYRKRCGLKSSGKVFHSFRHTFINELKQRGAMKEKIAALVGHEDGSETFGRYGKDYQPQVLFEVIQTLKFELPDLPVLHPPRRSR